MNHSRASTSCVTNRPLAVLWYHARAGVTPFAVALNVLFIAIFFLMSLSQVRANEVACDGNYTNQPLDAYMCAMKSQYPSMKLYLHYGGAGAGRTSTTDSSVNADDQEFNASMTKVVTVYMMLELLANNEGVLGAPPNSSGQPYRRNNWTLDTKVRIVADRDAQPAAPGVIYLSKGFASSLCTPGGGWAGVSNTAKLALYTPENDFEYSISSLIAMAMGASFNDAAVILGALVYSNISGNNAVLDVQNPLTAANSGGDHLSWITPFRTNMNTVVQRLGATNTTVCNPPGWASTAAGGCSARGTAEGWMNIAQRALANAVNFSVGNVEYWRMFTPRMPHSFSTAALSCDRPAVVQFRSTGHVLFDATRTIGNGEGDIKLAKTGSITSAINMLAVAEPTGDSCESQQMVGVVMGRPDSAPRRDVILLEMFNRGRQQYGGCAMPFDVAYAQSVPGPRGANMNGPSRQMADGFVSVDFDPGDIGAFVPDEPSNGGGNDAAPQGPTSGSVTSTADAEQCDPEINYAEMWAEDLKNKTNLGIIDSVVDAQIDKIFSQQCIGRLITLMQQVMSTIDTIRTLASSADLMGAVISAAATAIVRAILDQVFAAITNMICKVTNAITSAIDNVSKNLLCFKHPLFTMPNNPMEIPIDIESISCSGVAINPLYFSGDPNQPLARGSVAGFDLGNVRSGDRPYFCPMGTRPTNASAPGAGNNNFQWQCEPIPGYRPQGPSTAAQRIACSIGRDLGYRDTPGGPCRRIEASDAAAAAEQPTR